MVDSTRPLEQWRTLAPPTSYAYPIVLACSSTGEQLGQESGGESHESPGTRTSAVDERKLRRYVEERIRIERLYLVPERVRVKSRYGLVGKEAGSAWHTNLAHQMHPHADKHLKVVASLTEVHRTLNACGFTSETSRCFRLAQKGTKRSS